jgi:hypothetical protein
VQWGRFDRTFHSIQTSFSRRMRNRISAGVNWTWTLSDRGTTAMPGQQLRIDHHADGTYSIRDDQAVANALFADQGVTSHVIVAHMTWQLPGPRRARNTLGRWVTTGLNGWQLSSVFRADSGAPYDVGYTYQEGGGTALTGSPDYPARVVVTGDPGSGCSSNQYRQFNTAAFSGPLPGSVGLESGRNLLHNCGDHRLDLSLVRTIPFLFHWRLEVRIDMFNAFNAVIFNARNATMQLTSPTNQTLTNGQYRSDGSLDPSRLKPENAGFGAATNALSPRSVQIQGRIRM